MFSCFSFALPSFGAENPAENTTLSADLVEQADIYHRPPSTFPLLVMWSTLNTEHQNFNRQND